MPVTVWAPATVELQVLAVHEPSGEIENVVSDVTSPRELPNESKAWARCRSRRHRPASVAVAGEMTIEASGHRAGDMQRSRSRSYAPRVAADGVVPRDRGRVQTLDVHEPSGVIEYVVVPNVMSPRELP